MAQSNEMDQNKNKSELEKGKKKVIDNTMHKEKETENGLIDKEHDNNQVNRLDHEGVSIPCPDDVVFLQLVVNLNNTALVNFVTGPSQDEEGNSESEYIDATQMETTQLVDLVPKTQLDEVHKKKITDFLKDSSEIWLKRTKWMTMGWIFSKKETSS